MSVKSEARRDAEEYARAQMYFGEGAGNRRKLIDATVTSKILRDPLYANYFREMYAGQDMGEHALKARRERERRDRNEVMAKNVKGLATGNLNSLSSPVLVLMVCAVAAHHMGLDKRLWEEILVRKARFHNWQEKRETRKRHLKSVKEA